MTYPISRNGESGFTLFEICIAIAMIAIGFLAVLAALSTGITQATTAKAKMTAPLAARSAATYCAVTRPTGVTLLGGDPIPASDIPTNEGGAYHPGRPTPAPTLVNSDTALPFNGYALRVTPTAVGTTNFYDLAIEVYENVEERTANRNRIDTFTIRVFYKE